jgi:Protein of unknown function (DUF4245)
MGDVSTATGPQPPPGAAEQPQQPQQPAPPRRGRGTWVDMLRTMLVVLAFVVLIVLLVPRPGQLPLPQVDVGSAASGAQSEIGFRPILPAGLPTGWTPNAAEIREAGGVRTFHIGYITDKGLYAGVDQASSITTEWLNANDADGTVAGEVKIDGVTWQQLYRDDQEYTSLLLKRTGQVILVTTKQGGVETASVLARALRLSGS